MTETIRLAGGGAMPAVGLGLWKIDKPHAAELVVEATRCGYRHFDSACDYGNESEVGDGLKQVVDSGICRREDLWVTSKLWNTYHAAQHVRPAVERSFNDLRLEYLDLYLIHFPIAQEFVPFETRYPPEWIHDPGSQKPRMELADIAIAETWRAMEQLVRDGFVKHIGVCNFNCALLRDLLSYAEIRPAVLQVELHPYLTQPKLVRFCHQQQIAVTGFSPLGASSYFALNMAEVGESVLEQPLVDAIAKRHNRSPAQVVLRWGIQRGTAVIPKTTQPQRLRENLALFDFALTNDDMKTIDRLNRNRRFNDPGVFCDEAFGTLCPIYD